MNIEQGTCLDAMVHIKKIEIFGFKSFGFRNTIVEFRPGLVTISGPNGSGKSNILDAIIFAMGENKPRTMRVDKLRSLIHDIDGGHKGTKMVRASLHFDNTDRKIPIPSDTVEITREMDASGDNTYYINKKKTQRTQVLDLLDVANAGLGHLNALQQGTVTKIAEFSPEEKRKSIEDLVGLSYFDEKKEESQKQLVDADHRLEIALTSMGEVKKRIDDLEEQRNIFLRHKSLEGEIGRLNAVDAAGRLKRVLVDISSKGAQGESLAETMRTQRTARDDLHVKISGVDEEKSKFMREADEHNRAKASVNSALGELFHKIKEDEANIATSARRIEQIIQRLPEIDHELRMTNETLGASSEESASMRDALEKIRVRREGSTADRRENNTKLADTLRRQSEIASRVASADKRTRGFSDEKAAALLAASKCDAEIQENNARMSANSSKAEQRNADIASLERIYARLQRVITGHSKSMSSLQSSIEALGVKKTRTQADIDDLYEILRKTERAATQHKAKIKIIKEIMHEDYSIARLTENADKIGIVGFAYNMLSWEPKYERAMLAAGSEWLKSIVTKDITTMVSLSEYARSNGLPRLKIVALDAIPSRRDDELSSMPLLADHVKCDRKHRRLAEFLFGDVVIASSMSDAQRLASNGHRAVTLDGQLVEPGAHAAIIDINSKIAKLTRTISISSAVDSLIESISLLKRYIDKKRAVHRRIDAALQKSRAKLTMHDSGIATSRNALEDLTAKMSNARHMVRRFGEQNEKIVLQSEETAHQSARYKEAAENLDAQIAGITSDVDHAGKTEIVGELESLNAEKMHLEASETSAMTEYSEASSRLARAEAKLERSREATGRLGAEQQEIIEEKTRIESQLVEIRTRHTEHQQQVTQMREQEQEIIATSGTSVGHLKKYDDELDELRAQERALDKELGTAARTSDALQRDLDDLKSTKVSLQRVCESYNVQDEDVDVRPMLVALRAELESMTNLNTGAASKYLEITEGYRATSSRKNELEAERNKIVSFIEEVEKGKRQKFLDAFDTVEKEIRHVFTLMTGGNAWIELQNEDDIFNSGISYLIQFPNKPKRESASISGGEKSLAAIVFVLALQKLNPSPFYLFDEVDAHLDGPNSERLTKILVERSAESQFIAVSLKDSIVKKADLIYGVYPKNGVSHVVTYKDKQTPPVAN